VCLYAPAIKPHSKKAASLTCFQMAPTTNRSHVNFVRNDFGAKRRGTTTETATWRAAPSAHTVSRSSPLCPTYAATCFSSTACRPWPSSGKLQNFTRLRVPFGFLTAVLSVIDFGQLVCVKDDCVARMRSVFFRSHRRRQLDGRKERRRRRTLRV